MNAAWDQFGALKYMLRDETLRKSLGVHCDQRCMGLVNHILEFSNMLCGEEPERIPWYDL